MTGRSGQTLCVIPARGGSTRVPRKNIRPVGGIPMIARTIDIVRRADVADLVVVSTEDAEIADVARGAGASTPFVRPTYLADDETGTAPVVAHAVESVLAGGQHRLELVLVVYPTAILLEPDDLRVGIAAVRANGVAAPMSVRRFSSPIERAWRIDDDGRGFMIDPTQAPTRTQDLPDAYFDAGQFYIGTVGFWTSGGRLATERPLLQPLPPLRSIRHRHRRGLAVRRGTARPPRRRSLIMPLVTATSGVRVRESLRVVDTLLHNRHTRRMVGRRFGKFASAGLAAFGAGAAFVPAAHAEVPPESGINPSQSDSSDVVQSISQSAFSVINPGESRLSRARTV